MKSNFPTTTTIPALICNQLIFFGSSLFPGGKHLQNLKNPYFSCMFDALYFLNNGSCQKVIMIIHYLSPVLFTKIKMGVM